MGDVREEFSKSSTLFESGCHWVVLGVLVSLEGGQVGSSATSSCSSETLLREKSRHSVHELVNIAVHVEARENSNIILENKLGLWHIPWLVNLGQNPEEVRGGSQGTLNCVKTLVWTT